MVPAGRKKYWERYIARLQGMLKLADWEVRFKHDENPDDPNHAACVGVTTHRKLATVWFAQDWESRSPEDQRSTIIHELLHLHFDEPWGMVGDMTRQLGKQAEDVVDTLMRHQFEVAIDQIASAIAPHFPLPPARGGEKK